MLYVSWKQVLTINYKMLTQTIQKKISNNDLLDLFHLTQLIFHQNHYHWFYYICKKKGQANVFEAGDSEKQFPFNGNFPKELRKNWKTSILKMEIILRMNRNWSREIEILEFSNQYLDTILLLFLTWSSRIFSIFVLCPASFVLNRQCVSQQLHVSYAECKIYILLR